MGAGHISLDAVAERAGISKGGLLYNFPSKAELLKAMVAEHLSEAEAELDRIVSGDNRSANPTLRFLLEQACDAEMHSRKAPMGFLAAVAENPDLLEPVRAFHAKLVQSMRDTSSDLPLALVIYLAHEGLRSLDLLEMATLTPSEREQVIDRLRTMTTMAPKGAKSAKTGD